MRTAKPLALVLCILFAQCKGSDVSDEILPESEEEDVPDADFDEECQTSELELSSDSECIHEVERACCPIFEARRTPAGGMDGGGDAIVVEVHQDHSTFGTELFVKECTGQLTDDDYCSIWFSLVDAEFLEAEAHW